MPLVPKGTWIHVSLAIELAQFTRYILMQILSANSRCQFVLDQDENHPCCHFLKIRFVYHFPSRICCPGGTSQLDTAQEIKMPSNVFNTHHSLLYKACHTTFLSITYSGSQKLKCIHIFKHVQSCRIGVDKWSSFSISFRSPGLGNYPSSEVIFWPSQEQTEVRWIKIMMTS